LNFQLYIFDLNYNQSNNRVIVIPSRTTNHILRQSDIVYGHKFKIEVRKLFYLAAEI